MEALRKIDHTALKANQIIIIIFNILAFVLNVPGLAVLVALVMLAGTIVGKPGFGFVYHGVFKKTGWMKPDILLDNPEPHRFAQGFGGVVMLLGSIALFAGNPWLGWTLVWLVAALAALNAFAGFCAGCFVYYWLNRIHIPGFRKSPPPGTFPGMRPKGEAYES